MGVIGIVLHPEREQARLLARQTVAWATAHGHEVRLVDTEAKSAGIGELAVPENAFASGLDVAVCFGGDGTMLRTVDRVAVHGVPILGVNVGQLGYLSAIEPAMLETSLERCFSGQFAIEERMLVAARVSIGSDKGSKSRDAIEALNEIVLEKAPMGHTVRVAVHIDGEFFTTYAADGLILATPTGSTAYSFSARGPIVAPSHQALILTPVSPHMLFDRALVLAPASVVTLTLVGPRPGMLLADGQAVANFGEGDSVSCTAAEHPARLVRFDGNDFHRVLKSKFGLNDR